MAWNQVTAGQASTVDRRTRAPQWQKIVQNYESLGEGSFPLIIFDRDIVTTVDDPDRIVVSTTSATYVELYYWWHFVPRYARDVRFSVAVESVAFDATYQFEVTQNGSVLASTNEITFQGTYDETKVWTTTPNDSMLAHRAKVVRIRLMAKVAAGGTALAKTIEGLTGQWFLNLA